jgi:hypothetical protein
MGGCLLLGIGYLLSDQDWDSLQSYVALAHLWALRGGGLLDIGRVGNTSMYQSNNQYVTL